MITTNEKGYHVLPCGCQIGRLTSIYCGEKHGPNNPPEDEAQIIRRIWHKIVSNKTLAKISK